MSEKLENKSGLVAAEDNDLHIKVMCSKCGKILFRGCSLGLTVRDIKFCPDCNNPINIHEKWGKVKWN